MRADFGSERTNVITGKITQNLLSLLLHFFFFAADEWNYVGINVHGRHTRISGA